MDLLQEYVYIPLDVFQKIVQNKGVRNKLEAWLMFLVQTSLKKWRNLWKSIRSFKKCTEKYMSCA